MTWVTTRTGSVRQTLHLPVLCRGSCLGRQLSRYRTGSGLGTRDSARCDRLGDRGAIDSGGVEDAGEELGPDQPADGDLIGEVPTAGARHVALEQTGEIARRDTPIAADAQVLTGEELAPSAADAWAAAEGDEAAVASAADGAWHDVPTVPGRTTYDR